MATERKLVRTISTPWGPFGIYSPLGDLCHSKQCKGAVTGNTIHGRCLDCGATKHGSATLAKRAQARMRRVEE